MTNAINKDTHTQTTAEEATLQYCMDVLDFCNDNIYVFVVEMSRKYGRETFLGDFLKTLVEYCYTVAERTFFKVMDSDEPDENAIEFLSCAMHFLG